MTSAVVNASADSMGRWIDDLVVEQVDTDGDGTLETTLYPITDLLGSVHLLTDDGGQIVERITYDPDGTPHFWSADTKRPRVTRIAWTGDGALPTGDTVTPHAFEIGFSEAIDPASAAAATATLTAEGGEPQRLTLTLAPGGRTVYLTGATVAAGTTYTLHLEGLTDTRHNPLWPEDATFTVSDAATYQVLDDTTSPALLALLDAVDGLVLLFDEPVEPAPGFDMATVVGIVRQGQPVAGSAVRVAPTVLAWHPDGPSGWLPGGDYTLSALHLQDLAGNAIAAPTVTFTHLAAALDLTYLAYAAPTDSHPESTSTYGLTTLFQGRSWHGDLGAYYYRARWYLPEMGEFAERDPLGYVQGPSLYQALGGDPAGLLDPLGLKITTQGRGKARENGRTVRFLDAKPAWDDYWSFLNKYSKNKRIAEIRQRILRLQASEIEYRIRVLDRRSRGGEGGFTMALSDTVIGVNIFDRAPFSKRLRLAHELQHAYQFETGRLGYLFRKSEQRWKPILYDMHDEADAYDVEWAVYRAAPNPSDTDAVGRMIKHYPARGSTEEKISYLRAHGYGKDRKQGPKTIRNLPPTVPHDPGYHNVHYPRPGDQDHIIYVVPREGSR